MLRVLLWLVLVLLVLRTVRRLVDGISQGMTGQQAGETPAKGIGLVRDPVCGTFVVPSRALSAGTGADVHYFCSERCRQAWASR
jgi:YHS domain-containing protein